VPRREVRSEIHKVLHPATGRELGFGELADAARELDVPGRHALVLKPDNELRFIGKESGLINGELKSEHAKAINGENIVTGKAIFGADIDLRNTLYAVIVRPPVCGAKVKNVGDVEVALVAKEFEGQPIKPQWSREDDIHHAYFHAVSVDHLETGPGRRGQGHQLAPPDLVAQHCVAFHAGSQTQRGIRAGHGF
jgi:hypothetical protein